MEQIENDATPERLICTGLIVSEEFAQMMGLTIEQFHQRFSSAIEDFEAVHPEDRDRYQAYDDAYNANPSITQIEYRLVKPDGEIVHVREVMQPICDDAGRLIQSIITSTPTTVKRDVISCVSVCWSVWEMLSMSFVTRLRMSPRDSRSK